MHVSDVALNGLASGGPDSAALPGALENGAHHLKQQKHHVLLNAPKATCKHMQCIDIEWRFIN